MAIDDRSIEAALQASTARLDAVPLKERRERRERRYRRHRRHAVIDRVRFDSKMSPNPSDVSVQVVLWVQWIVVDCRLLTNSILRFLSVSSLSQ